MIELYLLAFCYLMVGTAFVYAIIEEWEQINLIDLASAFGIWIISPITLPMILGGYLWRQTR